MIDKFFVVINKFQKYTLLSNTCFLWEVDKNNLGPQDQELYPQNSWKRVYNNFML